MVGRRGGRRFAGVAAIIFQAFTTTCVCEGDTGNTNKGSDVKICLYLVTTGQDACASIHLPLGEVKVEREPFCTSDDFLSYDHKTRSLVPTDQFRARLMRLHAKLNERPFVVTVGQRRLFVGAFWSPLSSKPFGGVVIVLPLSKEARALTFERGYPTKEKFTGADPLNDPEFLAILQRLPEKR